MSLGIVRMLREVLLISLNCLFKLRFGIFALAERLVTQREAEMRFGQVRIESHGLRERLHGLVVLIVPVQLLTPVQQAACLRAIARRSVGHLRGSGTIIRALLSTALATGR